MAGYYEMKDKGACWASWHDNNNEAQYDYVINRNAVMRPNVEQCRNNALGATCSMYGQFTVPRTTQESFLQGRGQVGSYKCPDCEVIYLPDTLFPSKVNESDVVFSCQNNTLTPAQTRVPKSCYNVMETESFQYAMMPGAWEQGYMGYNVMCDMNIQDRENGRLNFRPPPLNKTEKLQSYGTYRVGAGNEEIRRMMGDDGGRKNSSDRLFNNGNPLTRPAEFTEYS